MHELGLTQNIVDTIQMHAKKNNVQEVVKMVLEIGQISGVVPEALEFCFGVCTKGTALEGAQLEIRKVAAVGHCKACDKEFDLVAHDFSCPTCDGSEWDLVAGRELNIKELEVI